jgi:hypothetical protein
VIADVVEHDVFEQRLHHVHARIEGPGARAPELADAHARAPAGDDDDAQPIEKEEGR